MRAVYGQWTLDIVGLKEGGRCERVWELALWNERVGRMSLERDDRRGLVNSLRVSSCSEPLRASRGRNSSTG